MSIRRRSIIAAPFVLAATRAFSQAGNWPDRPIKVIVGYAAGGAVDVSMRLIAPGLGERLGQNIVVENRTGGAGTVAGLAVAQAEADGYTLLCDSFSHVVNPLLMQNLRFDYDKTFTGITRIASFPQALAVKSGSPFSTLKELVAAARAKPGSLSAGFSGNGTASHLLLEKFRHVAGVSINTVPYRGAADAARDLAVGALDMAVVAFSTAEQLDQSGQAKLLNVATAERLPARPNLPTFGDGGMPNVVFSDFAGLFSPASTPAPIRQRLQAAISETLTNPTVRTRLAAMAAIPGGDTSEAFNGWVRDTRKEMAELIKDANIRIN